MNSPWLFSETSTSSSTNANRLPSVATMVSLCSFRLKKMPFKTYRDSSVEIAKEVFLSIERIFSCGRTTFLSSLNCGNGGNSSAPSPRILKNDGPERMLQTFLSSTSSSISGVPSSRAMPNNFLTGTVVAPGRFTPASTEQVMVTSRSVAVNSKRFPSARSRTLERIGKVVRVLTMFCTDCSPFKICSLAIVKFIGSYEYQSIKIIFLLLRGVNKANKLRCQGWDNDL